MRSHILALKRFCLLAILKTQQMKEDSTATLFDIYLYTSLFSIFTNRLSSNNLELLVTGSCTDTQTCSLANLLTNKVIWLTFSYSLTFTYHILVD